MIENISIKRIRFLNKKQREYMEYKLVDKAKEGCDESFEILINNYKEYLYKTEVHGCSTDRSDYSLTPDHRSEDRLPSHNF